MTIVLLLPGGKLHLDKKKIQIQPKYNTISNFLRDNPKAINKKLHKAIAVNPYIKLSNIATVGNNLAKQYNINDRHGIAFQSGLSAIVTFKYDIVASLQFQYSSPEISIQNMSFVDAIYFFTLEKTFKQNFKVGIKSILPFSKSFTYQGNEIKGEDFNSHSEGNIKLSAFPISFNLKYQFNSGKIFNKINRTKEDIENMPKKGF